MNFLKSAFATFYVLGVFCFAMDSVIHLFTDQFSLAWIGSSLVTFSPCGYFLSLFIYPRPRTKRYLNTVIFPIAVGTVITIIGSIGTLQGHTLPLMYVILTLFGWILYEFWFSKVNKVSSAIKYGQILPEFELSDHNGEPVSSNSFAGKTVVMLFFRGNWCPFSIPLIQELVSAAQTQGQDILPVFISSQARKNMQELANLFQSSALFLVDKENKLAKQFDVEIKFGTPLGMQLLGYYSHTALPTVIIVDPEGKVIYSDIANSFRVYPKPESYLTFQELPVE